MQISIPQMGLGHRVIRHNRLGMRILFGITELCKMELCIMESGITQNVSIAKSGITELALIEFAKIKLDIMVFGITESARMTGMTVSCITELDIMESSVIKSSITELDITESNMIGKTGIRYDRQIWNSVKWIRYFWANLNHVKL